MYIFFRDPSQCPKRLHYIIINILIGSFLQTRSWQGLEQKLGETPVTMATEGRSGIPICYTHEMDTLATDSTVNDQGD